MYDLLNRRRYNITDAWEPFNPFHPGFGKQGYQRVLWEGICIPELIAFGGLLAVPCYCMRALYFCHFPYPSFFASDTLIYSVDNSIGRDLFF
jgi:hypothetical protein